MFLMILIQMFLSLIGLWLISLDWETEADQNIHFSNFGLLRFYRL